MKIKRCLIPCLGLPLLSVACNSVAPASFPPLFTVPIFINGFSAGEAIVDTGGAYEVLLRDDFGLDIVDRINVLAFGGLEEVDVTESFFYSAGGIASRAEAAIVGVSTCDCSGLGFGFFRKTGVVLQLRFSDRTINFIDGGSTRGLALPFASPPAHLPNFDSAFIKFEVDLDGVSMDVLGLIDTGASATVMSRSLFDLSPRQDSVTVLIGQPTWGTVQARVSIFDTVGLPDLIVGVDAMSAWGDEWYFSYDLRGGSVSVVPDEVASQPPSVPF